MNNNKQENSVSKNVEESNKKGHLPNDKFVADTASQSGKSEYKGDSKNGSGSIDTKSNPAANGALEEQKRANQENSEARNDMAGNTQGQVTSGEKGRTIGAATKNDREGSLQADQEKR